MIILGTLFLFLAFVLQAGIAVAVAVILAWIAAGGATALLAV